MRNIPKPPQVDTHDMTVAQRRAFMRRYGPELLCELVCGYCYASMERTEANQHYFLYGVCDDCRQRPERCIRKP